KFYDTIRDTIPLTNQNVAGFDLIIQEGRNRKVPLHFLAYILATAYHETAATMQPVREYGSEKYLKSKKYYPYVGMGYVQLTWKKNYEKASKVLGVDFVKSPKLLLDPQYALPILFVGMEEGWFTGKKLSDYIDNVDEDDKEDLREFSNARRIVNGTDKQVLIGQYAIAFEKGLKAAGYDTSSEPEKPVDTPDPVRKRTLLEVIIDFILMLFARH